MKSRHCHCERSEAISALTKPLCVHPAYALPSPHTSKFDIEHSTLDIPPMSAPPTDLKFVLQSLPFCSIIPDRPLMVTGEPAMPKKLPVIIDNRDGNTVLEALNDAIEFKRIGK
jgi:hypothetical protein